jgi:hypothetical protein
LLLQKVWRAQRQIRAFAFAEFCQDLLGFIRAETADEVTGFDDNAIDTRISQSAE